ncbi:MAG: hypothetical protein D6704_01690 [Nitrospirae bacterium]|nr:MAG: hypothetical protein D6704_01690 [Nitrospirota bacterium]
MGNLRLRIRIAGQEFEGEGPEEVVGQYFNCFCSLVTSLTQQDFTASKCAQASYQFTSSPSLPAEHSLDQVRARLPTLLYDDPKTPALICRTLPAGPAKEADTTLILLLGYHLLRHYTEVPAILLIQSLKRVGLPVKRLDRMLARYLREHIVLKTGKGKGGKYRLSKRGIELAQQRAFELETLLPSV